ncbi:MAG: extracellular solute-binding protein [bacterium]
MNQNIDTNTPDIMQLGTTWTAYLGYQGALLNIAKYINQDSYTSTSIKNCKVVGSTQVYGLPWFADPWIFVYWKEAIDNPKKDFKDWRHFKNTCLRIQDNIRKGKLRGRKATWGIPIARDWNLLHMLAIWIWSAGGEIVHINNDFKIWWWLSATLHEEKALKGIDFLLDLVEANCVDLPLDKKLPEITNDFINGKYAMIFTGPWIIKQLGKDWKQKFGIAEVPKGIGGKYTFCGGANFAVLKVAEKRGNLDKAVGLVKYLCSPDSQVQHAEITGSLPTSKEGLEKYIAKYPFCKVFKTATLYHSKAYKNTPEVVEKEISWDNIYLIWKEIALGESIGGIKKILKATSDEINRNITRLYILGIPWYKMFIYSSPLLLILLIIITWKIWKWTISWKSLYEIRIYMKDMPSQDNEEEFLERLFNSENVRVEIKKRRKVLEDINRQINSPPYENQLLFLCFIAYMTKYKNRFISPTEIVKVSLKNEEDVSEEERPLYIFSREIGVYNRSRYSQWIRDIRNLFPEEEKNKLLPIDSKGHKINGMIRFERK